MERALYHLERYEKATGMLRNVKKTEVVSNDPDMLKIGREVGFDCPSEVKYLGCQVSICPNYDKMWEKVVKKMQVTADQ